MNDNIRLDWEPENKTPLTEIDKRFTLYLKGKKNGATLLGNGTLIFSPNGRNDIEDAKKAMEEAKRLNNFQVNLLKEGGFLVSFHAAIAVFVSAEEFENQREEIEQRVSELKFLEEDVKGEENSPPEHLLVGLYARGKLQRDAHYFNFYKRLEN